MNIKELLLLMAQNGFYNIDGTTSEKNGYRFYFSTGVNTRGDAIEVTVCENGCIVESWIGLNHTKVENIDEEDIVNHIKKNII